MQYKITYQDIKDKDPCYDPIEYISKDWKGTLIDILDIKECSFEDRLWVVTHFLGDKLNRLFAVYCARQALNLIENPDPRSINACDIAERFALGNATADELTAAWDAAWNAAKAAAWNAANAAAWVAAWDAAKAAAWDAANAANEDFEAYLRLLIKDENEK